MPGWQVPVQHAKNQFHKLISKCILNVHLLCIFCDFNESLLSVVEAYGYILNLTNALNNKSGRVTQTMIYRKLSFSLDILNSNQ